MGIDRGVVRLGIDAPINVPVHRKEIFNKIVELNRQASKADLSTLKKAISDKRVRVVINKKQTDK